MPKRSRGPGGGDPSPGKRGGRAPHPVTAPPPADALAGEFRFIRPLGRGAEGEVWLAEDLRRDGLLVAWKRLPGGSRDEPEEFRRRRALSHPVLSPVLESGVLPDAEGRWFTSPFFPGLPLDRLAEPLDARLLEAILHRALGALAALNEAGLRHGDLKPAHILWRGPGPLEVRLIDLGHAAPLVEGPSVRVGTPPYAAPELWTDPPHPGRNTDLYALAMCALERLRGSPVVTSGDLAAWRRWHERGDRGAALAERTADASGELIDAIAACLAPDPADRPRDAAALLGRLRPLPGEPREAPPEPIAEPPLLGRDEWLAGVLRALGSETGAAASLVAGARGSGRSRLLRALAARVRAHGGVAVIAALGERGMPLLPRDLSAIAQRAPLRVLLVDDLLPARAPILEEAWRRLRALGGTPAPRLVAALDPGFSDRERSRLAALLAATAGPVRTIPIPGLDRDSFSRLSRILGRSEGSAARLWRESGGAPGALADGARTAAPDLRAVRAAIGEPLASWLAILPVPVPWPVLAAACDLPEAEIWRRFAAAGTLAPAVSGGTPPRVLPWPVPLGADSVDPSPLAAAWRDADGETGRYAAFVLEGARAGARPAEWRELLGAARRRGDAPALAALAELAALPADREWVSRESAARLGDPRALSSAPPADPAHLSETSAASCAWVLERGRGPAAALPYALRRLEVSSAEDRAEALLAAARLAQEAGRAEEAARLLAEEIDEGALPASALLELGALSFRRGDSERAARCFDAALSRGRGGRDPAAVVGALSGLSGLARTRGDLAAAAGRIGAAIRFARLAGLEPERPELALNQGAILHSLRRTDEALAAYRRAETWIAGHPDRGREAHAQLGIGTVLRDRGDLPAALVALGRAVRRSREAGLRPLLAMALGNLGEVELLAGLPLASRVHREELLVIAEESGEPALLRQARIAAAAARLATGAPGEAETLLAAAAASSAGGPRLDAWEHSVRTELFILRGDLGEALRESGRALRSALRSGRAYAAAAALRALARCVAERGDRARARRLLERGLELARRDPCPPLSRIPLELDRLRLLDVSTAESRERAAELARETHRLALAEEFLIAAALAGDALPEELVAARRLKLERLPSRYGAPGVRALAVRRAIALPLPERSAAGSPAGAAGDEESAPLAVRSGGGAEPSDPGARLESLLARLPCRRAVCFLAAGKLWRAVASVGESAELPDPVRIPEDPVRWRIPGGWQGWVPFEADGRAALWLEGSGSPPESIDLSALVPAVREARVRAELEREREQARRLRAQVRRLREESLAHREQLETRLLTQRLDALGAPESTPGASAPWIVRSDAMRALVGRIPAWAQSDLPILIWGESGAGKTEIIRRLEETADGVFISENCAALPEPLLEAELFGYVPGAFTGADRVQPGLLDRCAGGTLVLDHIDELPVTLQAKLLRVLDGGRFRPLGGGDERQVEFRWVATVREDPARLVDTGRLRPDLYFRLQGIEARVPPLRERTEEIAPLLEAYLALAARALARTAPAILPATLAVLEQAHWPGNIRELVNLCQRWLIQGRSAIRPEDLLLPQPSPSAPLAERSWQGADWRSETDRFHRDLLTEALARFGGNQTQTAHALGISRRHLQNLLNDLGFRG